MYTKTIRYLIVMCVVTSTAAARDRYLLLDDRIIAETDNAELALGAVKKHPSNPLFVEDKPWEMRFDNLYGNVIYDEDEKLFKCWYSPFTQDRSAKGMSFEERQTKYHPGPGRTMSICYAASKDGLTWDKPSLGLVDYKGSKANNIVSMGPHGAGVFKDLRDPDPKRRYKLVMQGVKTSVSADGIRWTTPVAQEEIGGHGDTHNNALWAPTLNKYVLITRAWKRMEADGGKKKRARIVSRSESTDFNTWSEATHVIEPSSYPFQPYSMPTFYHGGVYLGIIAVHHQRPTDRVWPELAWSADTKEWHRICEGTPLIPLAEKKLAYDYGCIYTCANPIIGKDGIRIYYGASDYLHYGWRNGSLALATLRPDGFAGYEQKSADRSASITTTDIAANGRPIKITADINAGGSLKASIVDAAGKVVATAKPVARTVTDAPLDFGNNTLPETVRLKLEFTGAKVYSFAF
jgi:hypothetical protein